MFYYEVWFYMYDQYNPKTGKVTEDPRTDWNKEFTFYCRSSSPIFSTQEMIAYLQMEFPVRNDNGYADQISYIDPKHYDYLSHWFEITSQEFTDGCGIPA